jgi:hypothetical protein
MTRNHRLSTTGALVFCLITTAWTGTLFASQDERPSNATPSGVQPSTGEPSHLVFNDQVFAENPSFGLPSPQLPAAPLFTSSEAEGFGQRGGYRGRGRSRNGAAQAAIVIGSAAAIGGGAVLVYANRPECSANHAANGCGYGTKVTGTAVLSAGIVALIVGALSWR